jgi:hypothetical protein
MADMSSKRIQDPDRPTPYQFMMSRALREQLDTLAEAADLSRAALVRVLVQLGLQVYTGRLVVWQYDPALAALDEVSGLAS